MCCTPISGSRTGSPGKHAYNILTIDRITKSMQSLSQRAVEARNALVKDGKDELANIIIEIQKNEEELLIVR